MNIYVISATFILRDLYPENNYLKNSNSFSFINMTVKLQ
jgi:hypothetical protein